MRRAFALLPLALVIVITAGCGGGGTETVTQVRTQTSAAPLTKAEYIAQADAICTQYRGKRDDLKSQLEQLGHIDTQTEAHKVADILHQASDSVTAQIQALQALQPPPQDAHVLGEMLSSLTSAGSHTDDAANAYDNLDAEAIRSTQAQAIEDNAKAKGIAQGYGFKVCGRGD